MLGKKKKQAQNIGVATSAAEEVIDSGGSAEGRRGSSHGWQHGYWQVGAGGRVRDNALRHQEEPVAIVGCLAESHVRCCRMLDYGDGHQAAMVGSRDQARCWWLALR